MKASYKELLFALLSVQLGFVKPNDVEQCVAACEKDPSQTLSGLLTESEALSKEKSRLVTLIVDKAIEAHGGESFRTWQAFGGQDSLATTLARTPISPAKTDRTKVTQATGEAEVFVAEERPGRYSYGPDHSSSIDDADEIGRGGMGSVLIAFDESFGRTIAVKQMLPKFERQRAAGTPGTSAFIARFLREARVTGQLEHPGIVPVYELGRRLDGSLFYTMKLVRGRTLREALRDCKSLADRLKLLPHFIDLCQAVAYAHSQGVINRDIKPANVMVGEFGETVVLDWGTAKVLNEAAPHKLSTDGEYELWDDIEPLNTMEGSVIGTLNYMSPEQALGKIDEVDARSDIWCLGGVLYQILTGEMPFSGESAHEVLANVIGGALPPVLMVCAEAPADLAVVAEKSLEREKSRRYETAAELAREVEAFRSGSRIGAYTYSSWELVKRFVEQNKALSAVAALLFLVLLIGSGVIFRAYHQAEKARQLALISEKNANFNYALSLLEKGETAYHEQEFSKAGVFAAASLVSNPYNPYSPYRFTNDRRLSTDEAAINIAESHSLLFQARTHQFIHLARVLPGHGQVLRSVTFSPNGTRVAAASEGGKVFLFSVPDGQRIGVIDCDLKNKRAVDFSPDGTLIAVGGSGTVSLWNAKTLERIGGLKGSKGISTLCFSPDGRLLATAGHDRMVRLWSTNDFSQVATFTGHTNFVLTVCFSPNGKLLASADRKGEIRLWNVARRKMPAILQGHRDGVKEVRFSPDGRWIASASYDKTVRLWSVEKRRLLATLRGHEHTVHSVSFSPDGNQLASTGWDRTIRVWNLVDQNLITSFLAHFEPVMSVSYSPDGRWLASAGDDGDIRLWRIDKKKPMSILHGHSDYVRSVAFSNDGRFLASASMDRTIRLWSLPDRRLLSILTGHKDHVYSVDFSPDNRLLASSGLDGTIRLWSIKERRQLATLDDHNSSVICVAFSPDGSLLASAGHDKMVGLWSVAEHKLLGFLLGHEDNVRTVSFSPDGTLLASASYDHTIRLWDVKQQSLQKVLRGHTDKVPGVDFSPDGKRLVTCSKDGSIRIWDVQTGLCIRTFTSLNKSLNHIRYSPDGTLLLASGGEHSAYLLDSETGRVQQRIKTAFMVFDAAFSQDGKMLALDNNENVEIYPLDLKSWRRDPRKILAETQNDAGMILDGMNLEPWLGVYQEPLKTTSP